MLSRALMACGRATVTRPAGVPRGTLSLWRSALHRAALSPRRSLSALNSTARTTAHQNGRSRPEIGRRDRLPSARIDGGAGVNSGALRPRRPLRTASLCATRPGVRHKSPSHPRRGRHSSSFHVKHREALERSPAPQSLTWPIQLMWCWRGYRATGSSATGPMLEQFVAARQAAALRPDGRGGAVRGAPGAPPPELAELMALSSEEIFAALPSPTLPADLTATLRARRGGPSPPPPRADQKTGIARPPTTETSLPRLVLPRPRLPWPQPWCPGRAACTGHNLATSASDSTQGGDLEPRLLRDQNPLAADLRHTASPGSPACVWASLQRPS